jgi:hypothetical protein
MLKLNKEGSFGSMKEASKELLVGGPRVDESIVTDISCVGEICCP